MASDFETVFKRLRGILERHAGAFSVSEDTAIRYCLEAPVGPATLKAWGGKMQRSTIPVAWVQVGKAYVSFHHMSLHRSPNFRDSMSPELARRMQGKTCFNFRSEHEIPIAELEALTARCCKRMKTAGFIQ